MDNPFNFGTQEWKTFEILKPDHNGDSARHGIWEFWEAGLDTGNGVGFARKLNRFLTRDHIHFHQLSEKDKAEVRSEFAKRNKRVFAASVVYIRSKGFSDRGDTTVPSLVRKAFLAMPASEKYDVYNGTTTDLQIDHKSGRKIFSEDTSEYQWASRHNNMRHKTACIDCKDSGKRFDATKLGYPKAVTLGTLDYENETSCQGCWMYDPKAFNKAMFVLVSDLGKSQTAGSGPEVPSVSLAADDSTPSLHGGNSSGAAA